MGWGGLFELWNSKPRLDQSYPGATLWAVEEMSSAGFFDFPYSIALFVLAFALWMRARFYERIKREIDGNRT
jgi:hypothetical protein